MREVFQMWRHTQMVVLTAISAATYTAGLIAFAAGVVIIPGVTSLRPANVFPFIFGLLFGPAGAWGSGIGNLVGDIFSGTFGPGSGMGFLATFYQSYFAYKLWGAIGLVPRSDLARTTNSGRKLLAYEVICFLSGTACAVMIAWFLDLIGFVPFAALSVIITLNNFVAGALLGPPLLLLLYPRIKRWGLLWTDILDKDEISPGIASRLGPLVLVVGVLGGLLVGIGVSTGLYGQQLFQFAVGQAGGAGVWISVLPFVLLIVASGFMLSGREQVSEESWAEREQAAF